MELAFFRVKQLLPVELFLLPMCPAMWRKILCLIPWNTRSLFTSGQNFIELFEKSKTNKQVLWMKHLFFSWAFCLGGLVWPSYSAVCKLTEGFFWKDWDDEETLPVLPLQECPCPVLSIILTAVEQCPTSSSGLHALPRYPLTGYADLHPRKPWAWQRTLGQLCSPGSPSWIAGGGGRRWW